MQCNNLLREEKKMLLNILKNEYIKIDFSKVTSLLDNNLAEPRWMDVYVLLYLAKLPADITIYNTLLEKLSMPKFLMYFRDGENRYLANANEFDIKNYVRFLITNEPVEYHIKTKYIPNKNYIKEILKLTKFSECGLYVKHVKKDKFEIENLDISFETIEEASNIYSEFIDFKDFYNTVNISRETILKNYKNILKLSKDKKMLVTISNICTYFKCKFALSVDKIVVPWTNIAIYDEDTAISFQNRVIDSYHFFRNVINTQDKKDIISEIYNSKVSQEIKKEFEDNMARYLKITENRELIDWIVTISKESKYTLKITFDEQGVFNIDGDIIVNANDAKEYYLDYMDRKKEKISLEIYKNTLISRLRRIWNKFKTKFARV